MKKLFPILGVLIAVIFFASCKKETVFLNENKTVFSRAIPQSAWIRTADGRADSTTIQVPDLTDDINDYGGVLVYLTFFDGGVWEQIPEVYDGTSYSYFHYKGNIVIYSQPVNGGTPVKPPGGIKAKIVLIPSTSDF